MPALFDFAETIAVEASYNIAPTDRAAVIRLNEAKRPQVSMLRWGLIPFWAKDMAIGNRLINARAETVAEKPAYRAAYRHRRCLIPVDGFYEWSKQGDRKQPYYIHATDGAPFCFAGLWESWSPRDGDSLETFTILTRSPNAKIADIHKRMPVIVPRDEQLDWLEGARGVGEQASSVSATPDDVLTFRAISTRVNNPRNDGPELIEPDSGQAKKSD